MKRYFLAIACLATTLLATAQGGMRPKALHLKTGTIVTFDRQQTDSCRVIFTPEGDSLGIKVYVHGAESADYLYSQLEQVVFWSADSVANDNRNTPADLARNPEAWRLEFPRLRQGDGLTYEITHSTTDYGITFSLEWDASKRAQRWTCYEFSAATPDNNVGRNENWKADDQIPAAYQTTRADFSGYSRGHMCASNDRQSSVEQNRQTFLYSNMQPQYQAHNGGQWARLEQKVQAWGNNRAFCDTLYVVKAATIDAVAQVLDYTGTGIPVPKYFYMCLLAVKDGQYKAIGFWTEHKNEAEKNDYTFYARSIDEIEELTGIDFFCNLPDDTERQVEASFDASDWP